VHPFALFYPSLPLLLCTLFHPRMLLWSASGSTSTSASTSSAFASASAYPLLLLLICRLFIYASATAMPMLLCYGAVFMLHNLLQSAPQLRRHLRSKPRIKAAADA
jgi:hypothetical protein